MHTTRSSPNGARAEPWFRKFEEQYGIETSLISAGDAGQMLSRAIMEKSDPQADLLLGLDNNLLSRALQAGVLAPYRSPGLDAVPEELRFDPTDHLTPFDYGYFSIIYDSETVKQPPRSLEDLTDPRFARSLILMDPRTSSPGLGFLLWTVSVHGEDFEDYWRRLRPSILTVTEGWDTGYGLFTSGEAPLVLSYTTSPAYHLEYEETDRFRAAPFDDGHYMQIEGAGITAGAPNREAAERFIDFMLGREFQSILPLTNWMFPVRPDVHLPDSFRLALKPKNVQLLPADLIARENRKWIDRWLKVMSE